MHDAKAKLSQELFIPKNKQCSNCLGGFGASKYINFIALGYHSFPVFFVPYSLIKIYPIFATSKHYILSKTY